MPFAKNISKNFGKILSSKYGQKLFDHTKQCSTDTIKTSSKKVIQKRAEATGDSIGNKIVNRITSFKKFRNSDNWAGYENT